MSLRKKALHSVKWTTLSTFIVTSLQIIQLVILSQILTPKEFGIIAITNIVILLFKVISDFGISSAIIHFQKTSIEQLSTLFWLNIFFGVFLFLIVILVKSLIANIYSSPILKELLFYLGFSLVISPIGTLYQSLFQKELHFKNISIIEVISILFGVSITIYFAIVGLGVWSIVWGQLLNVSLKSSTLFILGVKYYPIELKINLKSIPQYLSFGMYQIGERIVNFLSQRIDQLIIGSSLGLEILGFYNFAFNLVIQPVNILNPIFTKVAFPVFSKVQSDNQKLKTGYKNLLEIVSMINAPILIIFIICAPQFIELIFGTKWFASIYLAQILAIVALLRSIANPIGSLLLAKGRADLGFKWNLSLFLITSTTIYLASLLGNAEYVALAMVGVLLLIIIPFYKMLIKPLIGDSAIIMFGAAFKPIGLAIFSAGLSFIILDLLFPPSNLWIKLFSKVFIATIIYLIAVINFSKDQVHEIKNLLISN